MDTPVSYRGKNLIRPKMRARLLSFFNRKLFGSCILPPLETQFSIEFIRVLYLAAVRTSFESFLAYYVYNFLGSQRGKISALAINFFMLISTLPIIYL